MLHNIHIVPRPVLLSNLNSLCAHFLLGDVQETARRHNKIKLYSLALVIRPPNFWMSLLSGHQISECLLLSGHDLTVLIFHSFLINLYMILLRTKMKWLNTLFLVSIFVFNILNIIQDITNTITMSRLWHKPFRTCWPKFTKAVYEFQIRDLFSWTKIITK